MEVLTKFIQHGLEQSPHREMKPASAKNNDPLKSLSKDLLRVCRGKEGREVVAALSSSVHSLIPLDVEDVTVTGLNKVIFVWESFSSVRSDTFALSILEVCVKAIQMYTAECYYYERVIKTQRVLRLFITVSQSADRTWSERHIQLLGQIKQLLVGVVFSSSQQEVVEVCALASTALCNVICVKGDNLAEEYVSLCPRDCEPTLGLIAVTAGLLRMSKGAGTEGIKVAGPLLMSNVMRACSSGINDFHAFSCLLSYLQSQPFLDVLLAEPHSVTQELMELLWAHCDSHTEGVGDFVISSFKVLLRTTSKHLQDRLPLHKILLDKLLPMAWNVKAKLKVLTVLVPWIDSVQLLETEPDMITEISECLAAQYLASVSGKLYIALVERVNLDLWQRLVLGQFVRALTSEVRLIRYHLRHYWLPATLSKLAGAKDLLISELSAREEHLPSLVAVYRECRRSGHLKQLPVQCVRQALLSSNDEMRADVIALIVVGSSPSDAVSQTEIDLLEEALPHNLNIDCPTFRHQLLSSMNTWLSRITHHFKLKGCPQLETLLEHLSWLWSLCMNSLVCGSNYQRKETVTKLCTLIVKMSSELLRDVPSSISVDNQKTILDRFRRILCGMDDEDGGRGDMTRFKERVLYSCLLDTSAEIQELGYTLLTLPFSAEFKQLWGADLKYLLDKMDLWYDCITRPKASAAESGALVYTLIVTLSSNPINFVREKIIDVVEALVAGVEDDHSLIATSPHVYGYVVALRRALTDTNYLRQCSRAQLADIGYRLVTLCERLVQLILAVFMTTCSNKDVSPSFEQMEEAVDDLVQRAKAAGTLPADADLSAVNAKVSAWCWLALKETCSLCGAIAISSLVYRDLLTLSSVNGIRDIFYTTLTRCRHRGVIEGTSAGLIQFCQAMSQSDNEAYVTVPSAIINQVMDTTVREQTVITDCSVTRRSGGFPIIVQSVLTAEQRNKQCTLFHSVVAELLTSCGHLATCQLDETRDLPQVHSLNILRALVVDAKLTSAIRPYLARVTMLCVNSFNSPIWALRNAATQLFASCTQRMIGQKKQSDGSVISTSCVELFSQQPTLYEFLLEKLHDSDPLSLNSEIFPILCLISTLSPCALNSDSSR